MRVTKAIREFIHDEVKKRIEPRYAAEADAAKYQQSTFDKVCLEAINAASRLYNDMLEEAVKKYGFLEKNPDVSVRAEKYHDIYIRDSNCIENVQCWYNRMSREVDKISKEIEVELELGGTKKELMEMLEKI